MKKRKKKKRAQSVVYQYVYTQEETDQTRHDQTRLETRTEKYKRQKNQKKTRMVTYHVRRIVHVAMRAKLGLDVLVAQQTHLLRQVAPVRAEQASVQRKGREQGHHGAAGRGGGRGQEVACCGSHLSFVRIYIYVCVCV